MVPGPDGKPQPHLAIEDPLFKYDNHATHYDTHLKFAFSDEFRALPEQLQVILLTHIDTHRMEIDNVKPDMRQFVQIDKMYPLMTRMEQMQILTEIGIQPDPEGEVAGLPSADTATQTQQHLKDTAAREAGKAQADETKRLKILIDGKLKAEANKSSGRASEKTD
jgi:hypothetical protein